MTFERIPEPGSGVREFFRVTPSTGTEGTSNIDKHLTSLADLGVGNKKQGFLSKALEPFKDPKEDEKIKFEFVAISEGEDEVVELYYSATGRQKTLEKRLRAIYPSSFDISKVHIDLGHKLIEPIKLTREEFKARLKANQLYRERKEYFEDSGGSTEAFQPEARTELDQQADPGLRGGYKKRGGPSIKSYALEDPNHTVENRVYPNQDVADDYEPIVTDTDELPAGSGGVQTNGTEGKSGANEDEPAAELFDREYYNEGGDDEEVTDPFDPQFGEEDDVVEDSNQSGAVSVEEGVEPIRQGRSVEIDAENHEGPINPYEVRYDGYEQYDKTESGEVSDEKYPKGITTEKVAAWAGGLHNRDEVWKHSKRVVINDTDVDGEPIEGVVELNPPEDIDENEPLVALDGPTLTEDGQIYVRPDIKYSEPNAARWYGSEDTHKDWMTTLDSATESNPEYEDGSEDEDVGNPESLETLFSHLEEAVDPIGYQVVFEARDNWEKEAQRRKKNIRKGEFDEPLLEKILGGPPNDDEDRDLKAYEYRRIKLIENKRPTETFNVNIRCVSLASKPGFSNDSDDPAPPTKQQTRINQTLQGITPLLDPLDGIYYGIEGEVTKKEGSFKDTEPTADEVVTNFFERNIILKEDLEDPLGPLNVWDDRKKHPEIVANGRELGEFIVIPSGDDMDDDVFRSTGVRDKDIEPLTRPRPEIHKQFSEGVSIGYAYDDQGIPEDEPTCIPEDQLTNHWAMFGASGSGKTINTISMLLSSHRDTDGPTILVDPKQGNMVENYCKAHYEEFGDLRDVLVFDVPDALPAVPFFDIRPYLYEGMNRDDAIQTKVDEFHMILQMVDENYNTAYVAKTVLGALIKANFDKKYGADSYTLEDLYETAVDMYSNQSIPRVSHQPQVRNILSNQLNNSESEFKNTMQAVINRLDDLQEDINLYRLFNQNPEWDEQNGRYKHNSNDITDYNVDDPNEMPDEELKNALDFRELLDEDKVVLFDTGDFVRDQSQRAFSMYILSALWGAVRARYKDQRSHETIDSTVKLVIEESAPIVSTELVTNTLIPEGREFGLSLGLIMQFPDQVSTKGVSGSFDEIRTNVQTKIYGQIDPSREIADGLVHGEKDAGTIKNKIRRLPGGEWIVNLPEPAFGVDVPPPFSVRSLEIPQGHPDSENPLSPSERTRFYEQYDVRKSKTRRHHGLTRIDPDQHGLLEQIENFDFSDDEDSSDDATSSSTTDQPDAGEKSPGTNTARAANGSSPDVDGNSSNFGSMSSGEQVEVGNKDAVFPGGPQSNGNTETDTTGEPAANGAQSTNGLGPSGTSEPATGDDSDDWATDALDSSQASQERAGEPENNQTQTGRSPFDDLEPLPFKPLKEIYTQFDFGEPDQLQAAVFAVEEKYDPDEQTKRFRRGIKTLANEANAYGLDITPEELANSVTESSTSGTAGDTTVDDVDPTADAGAPDATEFHQEESSEDTGEQADDTSHFDASDVLLNEDNDDSDNTDTADTGDTAAASDTTDDSSDSPTDNRPDGTGKESVEDSIEESHKSNDSADATPPGDGSNEVGETDGNDPAVDPEIADSLREVGISEDYVEEAAKAAEDVVESRDEQDSETATAEEESDGDDESSDGDHPAKTSLNTPLHGQESLLSQEKRESVDLTRDDIKFLGLVADAFRDDLDGYTLTDSMNDLDERAGNPDVESLIDKEYVEKMTVNRRTYYSLTRDGWRLINDGVPGNKFGDHMEKIAHRVGVYLLAEHLRKLPVSRVVEYGRHDGETFDVIAYDSDGEIHTVGEVETSSNNKEAVIEDYEKLAAAPGKAAWAMPKASVIEEVWNVLESEDLVDELAYRIKSRTKELREYIDENPQRGIEGVFTYSHLEDAIDT